MQKHVNLVDLVKSFPTNIFLQNLASIQKRTSPIKFAHLAEKSEKGSISNLTTKDLMALMEMDQSPFLVELIAAYIHESGFLNLVLEYMDVGSLDGVVMAVDLTRG